MLRVTLEIVPHGIEEKAKKIGSLEIANIGGDVFLADYKATLNDGAEAKRSILIHNYYRPEGAWNLVGLALNDFSRNLKMKKGAKGG